MLYVPCPAMANHYSLSAKTAGMALLCYVVSFDFLSNIIKTLFPPLVSRF